MKTRKIILCIICFCLLFLGSCGSINSDPPSGGTGDDYPNNSNNQSVNNSSSDNTSSNPDQQYLTASAYNDNDHYSYWQMLVSNYSSFNVFSHYESFANFYTNNRIKITLPRNLDAVVTLIDDFGQVQYQSVPTKDGVCYLFPKVKQDSYQINVKYHVNGQVHSDNFTVTKDTNLLLNGDYVNHDVIDLMFVVDTTCSMNDELDYLKLEIDNVINQVQSDNLNTIINVGILLYRDIGSSYVTLYSDFTTDVNIQKEFLSDKYANEGGDFEEAIDIAYALSLIKNWQNDSTKIIVHIADAPAHDKDLESWYSSIKQMASKGIRIISVASSGIDKKTEYLFRAQSLLTNGTYVFLTDDSGYGNDHVDQTIEEQQVVEYLSDCLARLISGYHQGEFKDPIPYN